LCPLSASKESSGVELIKPHSGKLQQFGYESSKTTEESVVLFCSLGKTLTSFFLS
jgi:hypothetical protein